MHLRRNLDAIGARILMWIINTKQRGQCLPICLFVHYLLIGKTFSFSICLLIFFSLVAQSVYEVIEVWCRCSGLGGIHGDGLDKKKTKQGSRQICFIDLNTMIQALCIESEKLRCVCSLVTMLFLLFQGTAGVRVGGRFGISANANMKSAVGLSPKTKSADGDKHDNVPAGGNCSHWTWW